MAEAAQVFQAILARLGDAPSYERAATLRRLGRCFSGGQRPIWRRTIHREGIAVTGNLEQSDRVKRLEGVHDGLADSLTDGGSIRRSTEGDTKLARDIIKELKDIRAQRRDSGQLGTLAMLEGSSTRR